MLRPSRLEPAAVRREVAEALRAALLTELGRHASAEGIVMGSSSWKITARNPE